jgi:hypothetical protein
MNKLETLELFANSFVLESLRTRVVREAIKKPSQLHGRVCHQMASLFPEKYLNGSIQFEPEGPCLLLSGSGAGVRETTWRSAAAEMNTYGGILIIDGAGTKFYAETEAAPRREVWAGAL